MDIKPVKVKIIRQMRIEIDGAGYEFGDVCEVPRTLFERYPGWFEAVDAPKKKAKPDA